MTSALHITSDSFPIQSDFLAEVFDRKVTTANEAKIPRARGIFQDEDYGPYTVVFENHQLAEKAENDCMSPGSPCYWVMRALKIALESKSPSDINRSNPISRESLQRKVNEDINKRVIEIFREEKSGSKYRGLSNELYLFQEARHKKTMDDLRSSSLKRKADDDVVMKPSKKVKENESVSTPNKRKADDETIMKPSKKVKENELVSDPYKRRADNDTVMKSPKKENESVSNPLKRKADDDTIGSSKKVKENGNDQQTESEPVSSHQAETSEVKESTIEVLGALQELYLKPSQASSG